jgi:DNA-binding PadR family transcriptional regulator
MKPYRYDFVVIESRAYSGTDEPMARHDPPPLKATWFHILLALADEPRHGFSIREAVEGRTQGAVKLWPATLYGALRELTALGLLEPMDGPDDPDEDQRRRYHRLTPTGESMLRAEADRLQGLVDAVRAAQG